MRGTLKYHPMILGHSPRETFQIFESMGWAIAKPPGQGGRYKEAQDVIDDNINANRNRPILFVGTWDMASLSQPTITVPRLGVRTDFYIAGLGRGQTIFQADDATVFTFDTAGVTGGQFGNFQIDYQGGGANTNYMLDIVRGSNWIISDILVLNAHKAVEFRYQQASEVFNIFCRNPNDAVTGADSAMMRFGSYFDGATYRRCITMALYNIRLWAGASGSTISHANAPRYCVDINGIDGLVMQNCHFVPAHCGMRMKMLNNMSATGNMELNSVYIDGVAYGARGIKTEAPSGSGTIGTLSINAGLIGNFDITYDDGALTESIALDIQESVSFFTISPATRITNQDVAVDVTLGATASFENYAKLKGNTHALRLAGGGDVSLGGRYETNSGTGVTLTGTITSLNWRGAVTTGNTTNVSNSATVTYEKGFGISDDGDTYWDAFSGGGGSGFPAFTNDTSPTVELATPGTSSFSITQHTLKRSILGKHCDIHFRIAGQLTKGTGSGTFQMKTSNFEVSNTTYAQAVYDTSGALTPTKAVAGATMWTCVISSDGAGGTIFRFQGVAPGAAATTLTAAGPAVAMGATQDYDFRGAFAINIL